jgi:Tol biopolymer transport system component
MLDGRGRVRITDFGLATASADAAGRTELAGTPPYMAPEQIAKGETSVRSDIYSLGLVLYEIFTGRLPYSAPASGTAVNWRQLHTQATPAAPSSVVRDIDPAVEDSILACLQKSPAARPASAEAVASALPKPGERSAGYDSAVSARLSSNSAQSGQHAAAKSGKRIAYWIAWAAGVVFAAIAVLGYLANAGMHRNPFEHFTMAKEMDSEHVTAVAISPDGAYLAAAVDEAGGAVESLWLRQFATNSQRALLQDVHFHYTDLEFSPDGNYIYFRTPALDGTTGRSDVYRLPLLGGTPARVVEDVDAPVSFTDAGKRLCLYRQTSDAKTYKFLSVPAEGGDEAVLATGNAPLPQGAACSPDGKRAVLITALAQLQTLEFATGARKDLAPDTQHFSKAVSWRPDGKAVLDVEGGFLHLLGQIGSVSYPDGKRTAITNDLNDYSGLSVTADGKTIATTQQLLNARFVSIPLADPTHAQEREPGIMIGFSWVDNSRIVTTDETDAIKIIDLATEQSTPLVVPNHFLLSGSICGGDTLYASGGPVGSINVGIFKARLDGSGVATITDGPDDAFPACSPDGKWLYYADHQFRNKPALVKKSLAGAETLRTTTTTAYYALSPDGKLLATLGPKDTLDLIATDTMQQVKAVPLEKGAVARICFSGDGKDVFYFTGSQPRALGIKMSTIWKQPVDGSKGTKLVDVPGRNISWMQASPDGTRLGVVEDAPQARAIVLRAGE